MSLLSSQSPLGPQSERRRSRRDPAYHLLNRATWGFTRVDLVEFEQRGYAGWLSWQLAPLQIDDSICDSMLVQYSTLDLTAHEIAMGYFGSGSGPLGTHWGMAQELRDARLTRAIHSKRQLFERVIEFWTDHFNVTQDLGSWERAFRTVADRDVFRVHALGNFRDLLMANAKSAEMLRYLDNVSNEAGAPNENYARELLELHTLGVDGGYNENDVRELARCFTGWNIFSVTTDANFGDFRFKSWNHDGGSKVVLGQTIPGGGVEEAEGVIDYIATHPSTARFLAEKMFRFFLRYEPTTQMIDEGAAAYLSNNGEIKDLLMAVLDEKWVGQVDPLQDPKLKRPMHLALSLVRSLGDAARLLDPDGLDMTLDTLGHRSYNWPDPDGYPDDLDTWGANVLPRWTLAHDICEDAMSGLDTPNWEISQLLGWPSNADLADVLNRHLFHGYMQKPDLRALRAFINSAPVSGAALHAQAYAMAACSPSFQFA
jgi:uncharacterized protein (DUF1800 family)